MDKNMIHIDDLVRQRLGGGEERERPAGWLQMRELLDQKMPVTPPRGGYNWRRMMGFVGGLILLASITVGGYKVISSTSFRHDDGGANNQDAGTVTASLHSNGRKTSPETISQTQHVSAASVEKNAANTVEADGNQIYQSETSLAANQEQQNSANTGTADKKAHRVSTAHQLGKPAPYIAEKIAAKPSLNSNTNNVPNPVKKNTTAAGNNVPGNNAAALALNSSVAKTTDAAGENHPDATQNAHSAHVNRSVAAQPNTQSDKRKSSQPAPVKPVLKKDTFQQLRIVQRFVINPLTRESKIIIDTLSFHKVAMDRNVLVFGNEEADKISGRHGKGKSNAIVPAAGTAANSDVALAQAGLGDNMVPLANYKVRSRRIKGWNGRGFDDVMRDLKFNMAQVRFYPGLILGYNNYSLENADLHGFHIGATGQFTFGENWSIMAELKYYHRVNNEFVLYDNYTKTVAPGLQSKVEHFFKFSALQSIEMPLAIRYAAGRWNLFAGPNFVYNFTMNPEEIEHVFQPDPSGPATTGTQSINVQDFNSRFSIGGLLGISYNVTPAIQLDLRATRNFWDNARGFGAEQISQQLFRSPSFQFSLGYRFSQKNRIPKAK